MSLLQIVLNLKNIAKICKVCLQEKDHSFPLLSVITYKDLNLPQITIQDMLLKVCPIPQKEEVENPQTPSLLCVDCLNDLKNAYILILRYEEALRMIERHLHPEVMKAEKVHEDEEKKVGYDFRNKRTRKRRKRQSVDCGDYNLQVGAIEEKQPQLHLCPICPQEFLTAVELAGHAHTHASLKKYLRIPVSHIPRNVRFFSTKQNEVTIFNQEEKLHRCTQCGGDFKANEFRTHLNEHRKQTQFKCDKCSRVFKKMNHLNTHKVSHLKEFPYKCEECGKGFVIKNNYDCHILTHMDVNLPHECKFCFKRFSNPEHLKRHQTVHMETITYSLKYKVIKCHHCLRTFKEKSELNQHECVPVDQALNTKFPCKNCNKVFKHSSGLYNHIRNIHKLKGAKQLCQVCGSYVANIYNHMLRHTGEKRFQCNQCEKRFIGKPQLRQHLLVHSGLKPYVCSVCGKAFNNLYNLQVHERIHKGNKCHICNICGKGFLEKSYLKKHMNVHTKL